MRTTVSISDELLHEARKMALERKVPLGKVIDDALRSQLKSRPKGSKPGKTRPLKTFCGTGARPGVDLNSSSELLAIMEDE